MKKIKTITILLVLLAFSEISSQYIPKKWVKVYSDSSSVTYIDTTSIRNRQKQIIFWSLKVLSQGTSEKGINGLVFRIKTQYVVNDITKRFSTLGTLYYDKQGKLIGDNYNSNITGAGEVFSKPINISKEFESIYKFVSDYLWHSEKSTPETVAKQDTSPAVVPKTNPIVAQKEKTAPPVRKPAIQKTDTISKQVAASKEKVKVKSPKITKAKMDTVSPITIKAVNWNKHEKIPEPVELPKIKAPTLDSGEKEKPGQSVNNSAYVYNTKKERFVTSSILTDGKKYVVQVSSWKNKRIAESQVEKLKAMGYNAFIVKVYIAKRHGTWNRVRVGYFDSLREAKKIQREIKRKLK